jgi:hypothetical protein
MLLLAVSAILFQRSATAPWIEARAADGRRIQVSPIGIADFGLGTSGTAPVECRWWPKLGNETLCEVAPGGEAAMTRLRRTYPLVVAALWTSVLALFLVALRIPRRAPLAGTLATMAVPILASTALWSLASSVNGALSVLTTATVKVFPPGFGSVFAGALLAAVALGLLLLSRVKGRLTTDLRPQ